MDKDVGPTEQGGISVQDETNVILGLCFGDLPSNLATAALFGVLTIEGPDDHLLESPSCIRLLLKLLKPIVSMATEDKAPTLGHNILASCNNVDACRELMVSVGPTSVDIVSKVQEILATCKELNSGDQRYRGVGRQELGPKWIAMLTMVIACFR
jgi:hypothetical protein